LKKKEIHCQGAETKGRKQRGLTEVDADEALTTSWKARPSERRAKKAGAQIELGGTEHENVE